MKAMSISARAISSRRQTYRAMNNVGLKSPHQLWQGIIFVVYGCHVNVGPGDILPEADIPGDECRAQKPASALAAYCLVVYGCHVNIGLGDILPEADIPGDERLVTSLR